MKIYVALLVIVCRVSDAADDVQCIAQFSQVRTCMRDTLMRHVDGMTTQKSNAMGDCAVAEAKNCLRPKIGLFILHPAVQEAMRLTRSDIDIALRCLVTVFEPYADDIGRCVARQHQRMDVPQLTEELKDMFKAVARNEPKHRALAMALLMIKINEKLNCAKMMSCAAQADVNLSNLESAMCRAGERCFAPTYIDEQCKTKVERMTDTACNCVKTLVDQMQKSKANPVDRLMQCAIDGGVRVQQIKSFVTGAFRKNDDSFVSDEMCKRTSIDGSMGFCDA